MNYFINTIGAPIWTTLSTWVYDFFSRVSRYLLVAIALNSVIWSIAFLTINFLPERYQSKWTLILPGAGIGGRVDIDSIGSASAIVDSGFTNRNLNPKVNYKSIAQSNQVIDTAASSLGLDSRVFGQPQIKLIDQTSMIFFSMSSDSAKMAQEKSWALYHALQKEIDHLRLDEIRHREEGIQAMLKTFSKKLNQAKNNLLTHQAQSNIVTIEQFNKIPLLVEEMRIELLTMKTQKAQAYEEMMTLHRILNLTSKQASQLLSLQADPLFKKLLDNQSLANAALAEYKTQYGENHPKLKKLRLAYQSISNEMMLRSETLVGKQQWLKNTALSDNAKRNELMYDLINKKIKYEGYKRKITQLEQQIKNYSTRIQNQTKNVSRLSELEREHQIAEAVFTSAVAKIDTGKSDIFASYPMLQLFMEPTLPKTISGARPLHIYFGSTFGSMMSLVILAILWIRRRKIDNSLNPNFD